MKNIKSQWPQYSTNEINSVVKVLRTGQVNYLFGKYGRKFEKEFSKYLDIPFAVAVANGTLALELSLLSLNLKSGDEVIVTPRSFFASVSSIIKIGAKPIFADVDIETQNISIDSIKKKYSKKTKAILCVHLAGLPCDMLKIVNFAKQKKLYVVEDCAQAHGAKINNKCVGTFGDVAAWSFCNDKIISTGGEGGMVTTKSAKLYNFINSYKDHGKNFKKYFSKNNNNKFRYLHESVGSNYRLTEIQSVIGLEQLRYLDKNINIRNGIAKKLNQTLKKYKFTILFKHEKKIIHSYYKYYFYINNKFLKKSWDRDSILIELNKAGISCGSGSCPEIYKEKAIKKLGLSIKGNLKNANLLSKGTISINIHHYLIDNDIKKIQKTIDKLFTKISK